MRLPWSVASMALARSELRPTIVRCSAAIGSFSIFILADDDGRPMPVIEHDGPPPPTESPATQRRQSAGFLMT